MYLYLLMTRISTVIMFHLNYNDLVLIQNNSKYNTLVKAWNRRVYFQGVSVLIILLHRVVTETTYKVVTQNLRELSRNVVEIFLRDSP